MKRVSHKSDDVENFLRHICGIIVCVALTATVSFYLNPPGHTLTSHNIPGCTFYAGLYRALGNCTIRQEQIKRGEGELKRG